MIWKDKSLYVGFFLALREIKRSNPWTTGLIIFVMMLTFFNMLLLGGILGGIVSGLLGGYKTYYSSEVLITPSIQKSYIEKTGYVNGIIKNLPTFRAETLRYTAQATLEYRYQDKLRPSDVSDSTGGILVGIDPQAEDNVTNLSNLIVAGSYLNPSDNDSILIGSSLIQKYTTVRGQAGTIGTKILQTADVGSKVRLTVNGVQKEVYIKGVITSNNDTVDGRIYMVDTPTRKLIGRTSLNVNEIAIKLKPGASDVEAKNYIVKNLDGDHDVIVQTAKEAIPNGSQQIIQTFNLLGNMVAVIALIVGAITIFIVIYVNAITRRKFIGILKGIGISSRAIEISYVCQALLYAFSGIAIASILILGLLVPFFILHPINYPLGKGTLAITTSDVAVRAIILSITAFISGFIPAWLVTKQNTLDSILGR